MLLISRGNVKNIRLVSILERSIIFSFVCYCFVKRLFVVLTFLKVNLEINYNNVL